MKFEIKDINNIIFQLGNTFMPIKIIYIILKDGEVCITDLRHINFLFDLRSTFTLSHFTLIPAKEEKQILNSFFTDLGTNPIITINECEHLWVLLREQIEIIFDDIAKDIRFKISNHIFKIVYDESRKIQKLLIDDVFYPL